MELVDWLISAGLFVFIVIIVLHNRRHTQSVTDFLVAGRSVGRNMLALAEGSVWIGAVNIIAMFEMYFNGGFSSIWWNILFETTFVFIAISGWLIYRYRQTRALTVAQFLDMRYSKKVRILAAMLAWIAGLINFGIFPGIGSRFFIYFCGLPEQISVMGVSLSTFPLIMIILLLMSLFFVFKGGQISIVIANFYQGAFTNIAAVIIVVFLFVARFDWSQIVDALKMGPAEVSRIDPFHSSEVKDFNVWYYLVAIFGAFYCQLSFLGSQACNASARTAHEYRMSRVLGQWRWTSLCLLFLMLVLISYTYLHHPSHAEDAIKINTELEAISSNHGNTVALQQTVTVALTKILPTGIMGLMAAVMLAAVFSTHNTFLHTWGTVFIQDVFIPFRRQPLTNRQHMKYLRVSIVGVAIFVFMFSLLYPQRQSILMYFALINNIWLGGSGAVIIGGLYWKRGTSIGAVASLILGAVMSIACIIFIQTWPAINGKEFPINGQWIFFLTMVTCSITYIVVSLMWPAKIPLNLDKLIHRGKYAIDKDQSNNWEPAPLYQKIFGITSEFSHFDRFTTFIVIGWFALLLITFIGGTIYGLIFDISVDTWAKFWYCYMWQMFIVLLISTIWLNWGGLKDFRNMKKTLSNRKKDFSDDGRVLHVKENE